MAKRKAMKRVKRPAPPEVRRVPKVDTDALTDMLEYRFGGEGVVIQRAADLETRFDLRRPCGIPQLDIACGGGLPAGGLSQIDGPEGVGKNFLLNLYFAQCQRLYGDDARLFMLCLEFPFDKWYARACGVKVPLSDYEIQVEQRKRQKSGQPLLTDEEAAELQTGVGKFYILRGPEAESLLDTTVEYVKSNAFQIGAVDSWDSMLTAPEEEKDLAEDAKVANASNVQTRWMKKIQGALTPKKCCPVCYSHPLEFTRSKSNYIWTCKNSDCGWKGQDVYPDENETTLIGIRQVRARMNKTSMRQRAWQVGGAWSLKHGKLIDIQLRPSDRIMIGNKWVGKEVTWELIKGKAGTHEGKTGIYRYYFNPPEVDVVFDLVNLCVQEGLVKSAGAYYTITIGDERRFKGKSALVDALEDDDELRNELWHSALIQAGLGQVRHR
jgi:RecA/RadA recombinase